MIVASGTDPLATGMPGWAGDVFLAPAGAASAGGPQADDALADAIYQDGMGRLKAGLPVVLGRYLGCLPDLNARTVPLDAAITVAMRSMRAGGMSGAEASNLLQQQYPALREAIREASVLESLFVPTGAAQGDSRADVPEEFGPALASGERRYRILRRVGFGAFGDVFLAEDRNLRDGDESARVALKLTRPEPGSRFDQGAVTSEAARARKISHPNVVRVYDRGSSSDGRDYIVTEYVEGGTLDAWTLSEKPKERARQVAAIGVALARGLGAIHSNGLVHRDLKPQNILMTPDGVPKIADFGIALPVGTSQPGEAAPAGAAATGNLAFMAPERIRGEAVATPLSDIYSLGGVLLYLLDGSLPLGDDASAVVAMADSGAEVNRKLESLRSGRRGRRLALTKILLKAVAFDQSARHQSAGELADDLERWLAHKPVAWLDRSPWIRAKLWTRRNPVGAALAVLSVTALLVAAGIQWRSWRETWRWASGAREQIALIQGAIAKTDFEQIGSRYLLQLWALDMVIGRSELYDPESKEFIWQSRLAFIVDRIRRQESEGRGDDMETWIWRLGEAYWEINDKSQHTTTAELLNRTIARLSEKIGPGDGLVRIALHLKLCDEGKTIWFAKQERSLTPAEIARATTIIGLLQDASMGSCLPISDQPVLYLTDRAVMRLKEIAPAPVRPR